MLAKEHLSASKADWYNFQYISPHAFKSFAHLRSCGQKREERKLRLESQFTIACKYKRSIKVRMSRTSGVMWPNLSRSSRVAVAIDPATAGGGAVQ